jgi:hypothetical protein
VVAFDVSGIPVELLFVRAVWGLDVAPDVPGCTPAPGVGTSVRPQGPGVEAQWLALCQQALVWRPSWPPSDTVPSWGTVHGTDGLDLGMLRRWATSVRSDLAAVIDAHLTPDGGTAGLGRGTHHSTYRNGRVRDADTRGVATIVVLPVSGYYASRPEPGTVVLSRATFVDDARWRSALDEAR